MKLETIKEAVTVEYYLDVNLVLEVAESTISLFI
jgi:hypothetical protein